MKTTKIIESEKLPRKFKNPILITGLPGVGLIGKTVADYLVDNLKGKQFAIMYSPHFPHEAFMQKNGTLRLIGNYFYRIKLKDRDLIVLTGEVQATSTLGQYDISGTVLDYIKKIGVKEIITIGGYTTGKIMKKSRILGVTNNLKYKCKYKKLKINFGIAEGAIVGIAGLLPALAELRKISGVCLLGETHGGYVDIISARNIVKFLSSYLHFKISMSNIEKAAKETSRTIRKIEKEISNKHQSNAVGSLSYIR